MVKYSGMVKIMKYLISSIHEYQHNISIFAYKSLQINDLSIPD